MNKKQQQLYTNRLCFLQNRKKANFQKFNANLRFDDLFNVLDGAQLRYTRYGTGYLFSASYNFLVKYLFTFTYYNSTFARFNGDFGENDFFRLLEIVIREKKKQTQI